MTNNMKRAVFYLLQDQSLRAYYLCACRLAAKAYAGKLRVYIYTSSAEETSNIDTLLWTFNDISFIPHKTYSALSATTMAPDTNGDAEDALLSPPVLIGDTQPPAYLKDVLINLTPNFPSFATNFCHIIEIITDEESRRSIARVHYKEYEAAGYENVTHKLG